jgi:hypothetical protein
MFSISSKMTAGSCNGYGQHVFEGAVATPYLEKAGLASNTLDTPAWTSNGNADKVFGRPVFFALGWKLYIKNFELT